eukprot:12505505-Ditylum_brightwellii.AAC.1
METITGLSSQFQYSSSTCFNVMVDGTPISLSQCKQGTAVKLSEDKWMAKLEDTTRKKNKERVLNEDSKAQTMLEYEEVLIKAEYEKMKDALCNGGGYSYSQFSEFCNSVTSPYHTTVNGIDVTVTANP